MDAPGSSSTSLRQRHVVAESGERGDGQAVPAAAAAAAATPRPRPRPRHQLSHGVRSVHAAAKTAHHGSNRLRGRSVGAGDEQALHTLAQLLTTKQPAH